MTKSKWVLSAAAAAAVSGAVAVNPAQAEAASTAEMTVKNAEIISKSLNSFYNVKDSKTPFVSPVFKEKFEEAKTAIAKAKNAAASVKDAKLKNKLMDRIQMADQYRLRAAYFIDAVNYGKKLQMTQENFADMYTAETSDKMRTAYDQLWTETRKFESMVGKVYGADSRKAFTLQWTVPAKITRELAAYEMTRYDLHKKLAMAITDGDRTLAGKLLAADEELRLLGLKVKEDLARLYPDSQLVKTGTLQIAAYIEKDLQQAREELTIDYNNLPKPNYKLSVLHTNDTHANVERAPRKITAIKEARAQKENSILLDAGDVFSGTLYFKQYEGQADLALMNMAGYDAMTFGNHEFDLGTSPLAAFVQKAKFPFVSANVDFTNDANMKGSFDGGISSKPANGKVYSAIVKEVNGEKVGIFGLTTAETTTISSPGKDVKFKEYITEAKETVKQLEAQGIDKIVALTHIGYADGGGDNDVTLAKEVEGIDVIVGGHSHTPLTIPQMDTTGAEPTLIVQTGELGKALGILDVEFDGKGKIIKHEGKLVDLYEATTKVPDDQEALALLNKDYKPAIQEIMKEKVAAIDVALNGVRDDVRTKETNLGNLITDGMLAKAKTINPNTVIALQNGGGIRESIAAGEVTQGQILTVLPFGNSLAIMNLKGEEIKAALEHSVEALPKAAGAFLHVSGMKYTYDSSKPAGQRVVKIEVKNADGSFTQLDPAKSYYVATNVFTAQGGDDYSVFKNAYSEGRVSEPGSVDWETFRSYLVENSKNIPGVEGRITDMAGK